MDQGLEDVFRRGDGREGSIVVGGRGVLAFNIVDEVEDEGGREHARLANEVDGHDGRDERRDEEQRIHQGKTLPLASHDRGLRPRGPKEKDRDPTGFP